MPDYLKDIHILKLYQLKVFDLNNLLMALNLFFDNKS